MPSSKHQSKTLLLWLDAVAYNKISEQTTPFLWKIFQQKNWTLLPQQSSFGYSSIPASLVTGKTPNQHKQFAVYRIKQSTDITSFWQRSLPGVPNKLAPYWYNLGRFVSGEDFFLPVLSTDSVSAVVPAQLHSYPQPNSLPVRTIFDSWRDRGESFAFYNWPLLVTDEDTKLTPFTAADDTARTTTFLRHFDTHSPQHSFLHLWDLDAVGHEASSNSNSFTKTLKMYDMLSQQILSRFNSDTDTIVIFADHGMTDVAEHIDPKKIISQLPPNLSWFADSTLLRIWSKSKLDRKMIASKLKKWSSVGTLLSEKELRELQLDQIKSDFFDFLFVLKPGYAFLPTSFLSNHPVKGMHGYLSNQLPKKEWPMVAMNKKVSKKQITTHEILLLAGLL